MSYDGYGFYFERAGLGAAQGAIAPAEQFFEGSIAEASVARELGQNSLDAAQGHEPVRMEFELRQMERDDIPGIGPLVAHLESAVEATRGSNGHERMQRALELAKQDRVWVLRVGDYGTTGLVGDENAKNSPLVALTRGEGISANDGSRGGSFGIGSAVGPMASDLSTVMYTSMSRESNDVVFAAQARLATHDDETGVARRAEGYFTLLTESERFCYLRNPGPLGPFSARTEPGTDIFLLGYRKAEDDPNLANIRNAFVSSFLLAIHRGRLVIEGRTPTETWTLNAETLRQYLDEETGAFYRALNDPEPYTKVVPGLGELRLYVEIDETLPRKLHTMTVRAPLMHIDTYKHTSIPAKYAAILDCSNPTANTKLRDLEPPQHDRWDKGRSAEGPSLDRKLRQFVKQGLSSKVIQQVGKQIEIKGLARLLPAELWNPKQDALGIRRQPTSGEPTDQEAAHVQGDPEANQALDLNTDRHAVNVIIRKPGVSGEGVVGEKGKDTGGSGTRNSDGASLSGEAHNGEGRAKIPAEAVAVRSWTAAETGDLLLSIRAKEHVVGDLTLVALGPGGAIEDDYVLPIRQATLEGGDTPAPVVVRGNSLVGLDLSPATPPTLIRLQLDGTHRYLLGVN